MSEPLGERESRFAGLFVANYGAVLAFARRRVGPDSAEDIVEETFAAAWRHLDELPDKPLPWLYRVAGNAVANQRRGAARRRRLDERIRLGSQRAGAEDHGDVVAGLGRLEAAWNLLDERDRQVLRLVAWEELDHADAARALSCSRATFRVRLHRARRRFALVLEALDRAPTVTVHEEGAR